MKITAKEIKEGQTIQYVGHHMYSDGLSCSCGSIKKSSPIIKVKEVIGFNQNFKNLRNIKILTECGLVIKFSTRQKVLVIN